MAASHFQKAKPSSNPLLKQRGQTFHGEFFRLIGKVSQKQGFIFATSKLAVLELLSQDIPSYWRSIVAIYL